MVTVSISASSLPEKKRLIRFRIDSSYGSIVISVLIEISMLYSNTDKLIHVFQMNFPVLTSIEVFSMPLVSVIAYSWQYFKSLARYSAE